MTPSTPFRHALRGGGRPQILLLGNGLEQLCGGDDWDRLLNRIDEIKTPVIADRRFQLVIASKTNTHKFHQFINLLVFERKGKLLLVFEEKYFSSMAE